MTFNKESVSNDKEIHFDGKGDEKNQKKRDEDDQDEEMEDLNQDREHIDSSYYKISMETTDLPGNRTDVEKFVNQLISHFQIQPDIRYIWDSNLKQIRQKKQDNNKEKKFFVILSYKTRERRAEVLKKTIHATITDTENNSVAVQLPLKLINNFDRPKISEMEKIAINNRTIQIVNMPIMYDNSQIKKKIIRESFVSFGEIETISVQKQNNLFNQAFITFKEVDVVNQNFKGENCKWSHYIGRHSVQIVPKSLTTEEREQRKKYCLKLSGLAYNTAAFDIDELLAKTKAKSCKIPRIPNKQYSSARYAYIYFDYETDLMVAKDMKFTQSKGKIREKQLYWSQPKDKICNFCGDPNHIAVNCEIRKKQQSTFKNRNDKRATTMRNYRISYADITKKGDSNKHDNKQNDNSKNNSNKFTQTAKFNQSMHEKNDIANNTEYHQWRRGVADNFKMMDEKMSQTDDKLQKLMVALTNIRNELQSQICNMKSKIPISEQIKGSNGNNEESSSKKRRTQAEANQDELATDRNVKEDQLTTFQVETQALLTQLSDEIKSTVSEHKENRNMLSQFMNYFTGSSSTGEEDEEFGNPEA